MAGVILMLGLIARGPHCPHHPYEPPHPGMLPPEERKEIIEKALNFIREYAPLKYEEMMKMKEEEPMKFGHQIRCIVKIMMKLEHLKEVDPEAYKLAEKIARLEGKAFDMAIKYKREQSEEKREKIKKELKDLLYQIFEMRQRLREMRIKRLEREIERLKEMLKERERMKDKIVEHHLTELIFGEDIISW